MAASAVLRGNVTGSVTGLPAFSNVMSRFGIIELPWTGEALGAVT